MYQNAAVRLSEMRDSLFKENDNHAHNDYRMTDKGKNKPHYYFENHCHAVFYLSLEMAAEVNQGVQYALKTF